MNIGILTNAFAEREFIGGCIDQFDGEFEHVVLVSSIPWHGRWNPDDTHKIALGHGARVEVGVWNNASDQLNYGLSLFEGYDWVVICDADERYTMDGIDQLHDDLFRILHLPTREYLGAVRASNWDVYWKTPDYRIRPDQTDYALVAIRPTQRFGHIRTYGGNVGWTDAHLYHFSYVRSDEQMLKKIQSFDASLEFDTIEWYKNVWLKWTPEMKNLHPVVPQQFYEAVYDPCPEELRRYLP